MFKPSISHDQCTSFSPLVLVPVFSENATFSKDLIQGDEDTQSISNVLKHRLQRELTDTIIL